MSLNQVRKLPLAQIKAIFPSVLAFYLLLHLGWVFWNSSRTANPWALVPENAQAVLSFGPEGEALAQAGDWKESIVAFFASARLADDLKLLETGFLPAISARVGQEEVLLSLHQDGELFFLPLGGYQHIENWFSPWLKDLGKQALPSVMRQYKATEIHTTVIKGRGKVSWFFHKDYLVLGQNDILIEDAIRQIAYGHTTFCSHLEGLPNMGTIGLVVKPSLLADWLHKNLSFTFEQVLSAWELANFSLELSPASMQVTGTLSKQPNLLDWFIFSDGDPPETQLSLSGQDLPFISFNKKSLDRLTEGGAENTLLSQMESLSFCWLKNGEGFFASGLLSNSAALEDWLQAAGATKAGLLEVGEHSYPQYVLSIDLVGKLPITLPSSGKNYNFTFKGDSCWLAGGASILATAVQAESIFLQNPALIAHFPFLTPFLQGDGRDLNRLKALQKLPNLKQTTLKVDLSTARRMEIALELLIAPLSKTPKQSVKYTSKPLSRSVFAGPFAVESHTGPEKELLWQDKGYRLRLFSPSLEELWQLPVWQPMTSEVYQVDIFQNGKLQYVFGAGRKICVVDRLGRSVRGFPVMLPPKFEAEYTTVFKLPSSEHFHVLVVDQNGHAYLVNRWGSALRSWNPRRLLASPSQAPTFVHIDKEDMLIFPLKNGTIEVLQLNARPSSGFPIILGVESQSGVAIEKGASKSQSALITVNNAGELIKVSLTGKLLKRNALEGLPVGANYKICSDEQDKDVFVVGGFHRNHAIIYNEKGEMLVNHKMPQGNVQRIQFFKLDGLTKVIAISTATHSQLFLLNGEPIGEPIALKGKLIMELLRQKRSLQAYGQDGDTLKAILQPLPY